MPVEVKKALAQALASEANDTASSNGGYVVQKQVKQKILQAQQEEALFVSTSPSLQNKMEKVEQQLNTSSSMNGYHIGHHMRKDASQISLNNNSVPASPQVPPKCPLQPEPQQNGSQVKQQQTISNSKPDTNGNIASNYFQAKYGEQDCAVNGLTSSTNNHPQTNSGHRSQSVGFNGNRTRSNTQTPERDLRASSQTASDSSGKGRRPSFSYLSLLSKDGEMPHRTQPIGNLQTSKQSGSQEQLNKLGSQEQLNNFRKPSLMARSNPIGLAEPSVKRDGYAVSRDGSFYRSSENMFENKPQKQTGSQSTGSQNWTGRSVSATPDREMGSGNWKDQRRSSTSSTGSGSVRSGGGLIETGKPVKQSFLPFGGTGNPIKPNYVIKKAPNRSRSQSRPPTGPPQTTQTATSTTSTTARSNTSVATNTSHHQQQQTSLSSSSSTTIDTTKVEQHSSLTTSMSMMEKSSTISTTSTTGVAFKELDIALKKIAKEQEEPVSVEMTLPSKKTRARSLSRNNTETLPDENVTISLPGSKRGSRQPSVDREGLKRSDRSSSMEIFTGIYEIKVPHPSNMVNNKNKYDSVNEIHTDTIRLKSGTSDEETTQVTLKAPNSKHASRESLAICNTSNSGRGGSTIGGGGSTVEGRSGSLGVSVAMPNEQKSFNSYTKRDLAKTENDSAMTKAVTTTTSSTTDLASKKQQCITKATTNSAAETAASTTMMASTKAIETALASTSSVSAVSSLSSMTHLQQKNTTSSSLNNASFEQQNTVSQQSNLNAMTSSTSTKKITTAQSSMSQNSTMMHQTSSSLMQQTSAASKTTSNEALTTSNEFVTQGQGKFNISNALKKTSHHNSQEDVNSNRIRSRNVSGQATASIVSTASTAASAFSASTGTSTVTKRSRDAASSNGNVVGCALKGLDDALDALAKEQKQQEIVATKYQSKSINVTENGEGVTSVTVSLPSSKRTSRCGSVNRDQQPLKQRSRRNSIDLYTADYNIKLICDKAAAENQSNMNSNSNNQNQNNNNQNTNQMKMIQRSSSHIRVEDMANSKLKFCPRCHSPHCSVNECKEFGNLMCPRCMEWEHWEDSCWTTDDPDDLAQCETCLEYGHVSSVHDVTDFRQRNAIVDTVGWQPFQQWFYENSFRSWWQLNGLVGVPLYRVYQRKSDWKCGGPIEPTTTEPDDNVGKQPADASSIVEKAAALAEKYSTQYKLQRDDSTDELLKSVHAQREARKKQLLASANRQNNNDDDSGRSTPEHLKKYSGSAAFSDNANNCNGTTGSNSAQAAENSRRLRTFSETLKMLDDDILEELDVK